MPIPFLLAGLGVAAGVIGAGGHLSAKETNEEAKRVSEDAQELYNNAKESLERAQNITEKALLKLGYEKKNILDSSINQFLESYDKIKHIQFRETVGINEISKFTIDQQDAIELKEKLREMTDIHSSLIKSGVTGAAAGAVIALAASGSLSIVTSGLATAGTALMAGEAGAAAGIAGSALSFGAAMTPLAAVAAPVILFTGISASMKADENLEKANVMYAEAEEAVEKMKISETLCNAIADRSEMFDGLLVDLNKMFAECTRLMAGVIRKKEGRIFKKKLTLEDFSENECKLFAVTRSLAGAVKTVIDTPILTKDGKNIYYESEKVYDTTVEELPGLNQKVVEVRSINYNVKPVEAKITENTSNSGGAASGRAVMTGARNVFAFVIGFIMATMFAGDIAIRITSNPYKFLSFDSLTANRAAVWLLLVTTITIFVGKFRHTIIEKLSAFVSGIALFILFVQYCRAMEFVDHYIILSVIIFVVLSVLYEFFEGRKDKWQFGLFLSAEAMCIGLWPIGFLIYKFFSDFIGFSSSSCFIVISIVAAIVMVGGMVDIVKD